MYFDSESYWSYIANKGNVVKNEWENDDIDFFPTQCGVYKKLGQVFFHTYWLT